MLTIEARMIYNVLAHSPIFYKHMMLFICPFLDARLTTHHSNTGVWLRNMLNKRNLYVFICRQCSADESSGQRSSKSIHHKWWKFMDDQSAALDWYFCFCYRLSVPATQNFCVTLCALLLYPVARYSTENEGYVYIHMYHVDLKSL